MALENGHDVVEKATLSTRNDTLAFGTQAKTPIVGLLEAADSNQPGL